MPSEDERAVTTQAPGKTCSIIIVDDQKVFLDLARSLLETQPGIRVVGEAASGEEALTLAKKLTPEAVLLDIQMPGINGFETARLLLQDQPGLRIVIMSAFDDPQYGALARVVGAQGFFSKKSFPVERIAATLRGS